MPLWENDYVSIITSSSTAIDYCIDAPLLYYGYKDYRNFIAISKEIRMTFIYKVTLFCVYGKGDHHDTAYSANAKKANKYWITTPFRHYGHKDDPLIIAFLRRQGWI
ncbi:hypothetical protein NPIL_503171 [Nephila pilipes]|uniref:Uncharacterized protein n=1 Tax=Nephila pilipes TaxID=299642 RepID=A0A8X6NVM6_NEPPI|nr:hypothetical protein NPIL_503171 [Nephila pilipes]